MAAGKPTPVASQGTVLASLQGRKRQKLEPLHQAATKDVLAEAFRQDRPAELLPDSQPAGPSGETETQASDSEQEDELEEATPGAGAGASFARAFAKILSQRTGPSNKVVPTKIDQSWGHPEQIAHHLRQNLRRRDHMVVLKLGKDGLQDAAEKALMKTATRGVVQLFNAVSAAQHRRPAGLKNPAQVSKKAHVPLMSKESSRQQPGWDVLKPEYDPFREKGGTKLKDWNQEQAGSDSEVGTNGSDNDSQ